MVRKMIGFCILAALLYVIFIQVQLWLTGRKGFNKTEVQNQSDNRALHKVYSFTFSKYDTDGGKEFEIEGDSANIFARDIILKNVIAKAFAQDSPITITADDGVFNKSTSDVHLENNVIATTDTGARLLTEKLDVNTVSKTVATDVQAKVKRDNINIEGLGATGDSELKKVKFKKNVTVVIQNPDSDTKTPTIITSDGPLEIDYQKNIAHFSDNVVVKDMRGQMFADYMDVFYNEETKKVFKIISTGNVVIVNKEGNTTYSDNAIYLAEEGKIILGGDVEAVGNKESKSSIAAIDNKSGKENTDKAKKNPKDKKKIASPLDLSF